MMVFLFRRSALGGDYVMRKGRVLVIWFIHYKETPEGSLRSLAGLESREQDEDYSLQPGGGAPPDSNPAGTLV